MTCAARGSKFMLVAGCCAAALHVASSPDLLAQQPRGQAPAQAAPRDPCAAPANKIVAENCKPGNPSTEWDINGVGDVTIQGFSTDISYNVGETAAFKVKTDSPRYRIDIYRTGYYGGLGARLVGTVQPSASLPQGQPECTTDWSVRLYDCGNWAVSASWQIPADAVSGVYVARLVREDPGGTWRMDNNREPGPKPASQPHAYGAQGIGKLRNPLKEPRASHIVFIVRDDASKADIVMQTSDPTWTAYNQYGLGSSYNGTTASGEGGGQALRANKVSFNRPQMNRGGGSVNQYFNAEYALSRFLERNGYDVTYFAGVDADRRGELLKNHKLFISVGHDEYWSKGQRTNVEAARDKSGVNLAFMSGNEVFWKTRYEPSIDGSKAPWRTLAIYKETHTRLTDNGELQPGRKIDPLAGVWTGTWRESSPYNPEGPQPENDLTGTIFTVNANRQDPLVVPAKFGKLRFWRNTEVAMLKAGEEAVLGNGILGHEWDEDLDNGFRRPGIIHLSETIIDGVPYIQDYGSVYDSGTATHNLTLYRVKSGALVFGAGCVQYAWGLDNFHDNPTAVAGNRANPYSHRVNLDSYGPVKTMQQATVNLFADMNIQPANLQRDLIPATPSSDKRAPISKILAPADQGTIPAGVLTITGTATDSGGGVVTMVEVSTDGGTTWKRATGTDRWTYEWDVPLGLGTATILSRAVDDSVNLETPSKGFTIGGRRSVTP
jgi:Bacterial Ig domain